MMVLEWYEWECPYCRRIGQVNPSEEYADGESMYMTCPHCGKKVVLLCEYEPAFIAYRPESLRGWESR